MKTFMQRKASNELKSGYFGLVIESFECDHSSVQNSLPKLMGEFLFYHIVDTPQTATRIISAFNSANLPGEVNFFVLSVLENCDSVESDILAQLSFDAKFKAVFQKILCEKPSKCDEFELPSNETSLQVSQVDSAFTEQNETLDDTETNSDVSFLDLYHKEQQLADMEEATRYEISENSYRMESTVSQISTTNKTLDKQQHTVSRIQQIQSSMAEITQKINSAEMYVQMKQTELAKHEAKVRDLTESIEHNETEMTLELLTEQEVRAVQSVQTEIVEKKMQLQQVNAVIKELQDKRDNISEYHDNSLMSRFSHLEEQSMIHVNNTSELNRQSQLQLESQEIEQQALRTLAVVRAQIAQLQSDFESAKKLLVELEQQKLKIEGMQQFAFRELEHTQIHRQSLITELNRLRAQKPYDATEIHNPDIIDMTEEDIDNNLSIARYQLKTYDNTNSFDMNLLDTFKRDRHNFMQRRKDLSNMEHKITQLMEKLEANIKTSVKNTFDKLAKRFSANFVKFVPNGCGRLHLVEQSNSQLHGNSEIVLKDGIESTSDAIGLNIFARFEQEEKSFNNLFGQERRVAALVFIISMQQLCPMPFYLFECIEEVINFIDRIKMFAKLFSVSFYPFPQIVLEPYSQPFINYLNELSNGPQIIATLRSPQLLDGPNFSDNIFQSTLEDGVPHVKRISRDEQLHNHLFL